MCFLPVILLPKTDSILEKHLGKREEGRALSRKIMNCIKFQNPSLINNDWYRIISSLSSSDKRRKNIPSLLIRRIEDDRSEIILQDSRRSLSWGTCFHQRTDSISDCWHAFQSTTERKIWIFSDEWINDGRTAVISKDSCEFLSGRTYVHQDSTRSLR